MCTAAPLGAAAGVGLAIICTTGIRGASAAGNRHGSRRCGPATRARAGDLAAAAPGALRHRAGGGAGMGDGAPVPHPLLRSTARLCARASSCALLDAIMGEGCARLSLFNCLDAISRLIDYLGNPPSASPGPRNTPLPHVRASRSAPSPAGRESISPASVRPGPHGSSA